MNLRHAAALALVGWYLMVAPTNPNQTINDKAPNHYFTPRHRLAHKGRADTNCHVESDPKNRKDHAEHTGFPLRTRLPLIPTRVLYFDLLGFATIWLPALMFTQRRFWIVWLLAITFWPRFVYATAIIAVWTPETAVIGADSLLGFSRSQKTQFVCKIGETNNIFWAASGIVHTSDQAAVNFNVYRIAADAIKSSRDFDGAVATFERWFIVAAVRDLRWKAQFDPSGFASAKRFFLQIVFAGLDHNKPRMAIRQFNIEPNSSVKAVTVTSIGAENTCPSSHCGAILHVAMGTNDAIVADATGYEPDIWFSLGIVPAVERLLTIQAAATPTIVGGPLAIVEITSSGVKWPDVGICEDAEIN
jgi:hypothetical protein